MMEVLLCCCSVACSLILISSEYHSPHLFRSGLGGSLAAEETTDRQTGTSGDRRRERDTKTAEGEREYWFGKTAQTHLMLFWTLQMV